MNGQHCIKMIVAMIIGKISRDCEISVCRTYEKYTKGICLNCAWTM